MFLELDISLIYGAYILNNIQEMVKLNKQSNNQNNY